jgi:nitrate/TMAO reductase-like tetraheme cytochrome c subunit
MDMKSNKPILELLSSSWLSMLGTALVTAAGVSWFFVLPMQIRGQADNPYIGLVVFIFIPVIFCLGLVLIPVGIFLARRSLRRGLAVIQVDRRVALRRLAVFFVTTTVLNVVIASQGTYRTVNHMETVQFCGQTCHVMKPEFTAHQNSPHAEVRCVECHVAPGASGWVASKSAGVRQLMDVTFNSYTRPIASAMESRRLVPASETCEHCHWPQKANAVKLRVIPNYEEDEHNTKKETVLMMLVGGGRTGGIHGAHFGPGIEVRYAAADAKRQTIPWVEYKNRNTGEVRTFVGSDSKAAASGGMPTFVMQCVDCHNRPTHTFELPERAVNSGLAKGIISSTLPFIRKKGVELIKAQYSSSEDAAQKLPSALMGYYQRSYPTVAAERSSEIGQAAKALVDIYSRNVFPDLKVTWGTYPNNLGHTDFPGCFRCHDGAHTASDQKTITQDCGVCHNALAVEEASPEVLKTLGLVDAFSRLKPQ